MPWRDSRRLSGHEPTRDSSASWAVWLVGLGARRGCRRSLPHFGRCYAIVLSAASFGLHQLTLKTYVPIRGGRL
ncbi:MAG: hypothetical protein NVS3B21_33490 [Acidimicrobiales bacterium]